MKFLEAESGSAHLLSLCALGVINLSGKPNLKRVAKVLLFRLGVASTPNPIFYSNLSNIRYYFLSRHRDPSLAKAEVACIMCTWMEESMVSLALESSKDFVSRYIVVDKDGSTIQAIESSRDKWGLDMEIHVKPEMTLREARAFALRRIDEPWILVQDGDEVFHTDGPSAISTLRRFMDRPHIVLCTPINRLCGDLRHTSPTIPRQPPHMFLYHNNGTVRAPDTQRDFPIMDGWKINLVRPYMFNCVVKSPRRMFLRKFWKKWCQETEAYLKYSSIEEYIEKELDIDIDTQVEKWYRNYMDSLIPYDERRWGYYPEVIQRHIKRIYKRGK